MPSLFRQPCQCHRPMIAPKWGDTCGQCAGTLPGCTPPRASSDAPSTVIPPVGHIEIVSRETLPEPTSGTIMCVRCGNAYAACACTLTGWPSCDTCHRPYSVRHPHMHPEWVRRAGESRLPVKVYRP